MQAEALERRYGRARSRGRLRWRKTGDWPGPNDNRIADHSDGFYLLESDGDGLEWYARRWSKNLYQATRNLGVFSSLEDAKKAAETDARST